MSVSIPSNFPSILPWIKENMIHSLENVYNDNLLTSQKVIGIVILIFAGLTLYLALKYWQEDPPSASYLSIKEDELEDSTSEEDEAECIARLAENKFASLEEKLECAKKAGKSLKSLDLSEREITDEQIEKFLKTCSSLTHLDLDRCSNLTNRGIKSLPSGLTTLNLKFCYKLTDEAINDLPKGLTSLNLSECPNLTNAAIKDLPRNLTKLDLSGCPNLTDAAIKDLPSELKALYLRGTNLKDTKLLKAILPSCSIFI